MSPTTKTTKATKRLDALRARVSDAAAKLAEVHDAHRQARADLEAATLALAEVDLPADGSRPSDGEAGAAWDSWHDARTRVGGPWEVRVDRAQRMQRQAEADLGQFIADHVGELVADLEPDADRAVAEIGQAARRLSEALDFHAEVAARSVQLIRHVPGLDGRDVPSDAGRELRQPIKRLLAAGIERPLPRSLYAEETPAEPRLAGFVTDAD